MVRKADYPVLDSIINRWSSRALSGEPITQQELMSLFEAARWAPSSFNNQPWRFIFARKEDVGWDTLFNLLVPFNQSWAKNGSALIMAISHKTFEYNEKPSRTHSLNTGAATQNLALQGYSMGLVVHGVEGFDYDQARKKLNIPEDYDIEAMYVIGKPGSTQVLPPELHEREVLSGRKDFKEFVFSGFFGQPFDKKAR